MSPLGEPGKLSKTEYLNLVTHNIVGTFLKQDVQTWQIQFLVRYLRLEEKLEP